MLLNSVIIILREVLEAAVLIALLLVLTRQLEMNLRWLAAAFLGGGLGAWVYGGVLGDVSELFEGVGQEIVNASIQFFIYLCLMVIIYAVASHKPARGVNVGIYGAMVLATVFAITREGSEIYLFLSAFLDVPEATAAVYSGAVIGLGIGCSLGVLCFAFFTRLPERLAQVLTLIMLALVAAGLCLQATQLLIQANWINSAGPIWDTSAFVDEKSFQGQLLYAIWGYEASPSPIEVALYIGSLALLAALFVIARIATHPTQPSRSL